MGITQSQCARLAILMLSEYQKYLKKSHFIHLSFEEWLQKIIDCDTAKSESDLVIEPLN